VRWVALWLVLFGAYAACLGIDAFRDSDYGGDEPHYLLTAESIVSDGDIDLSDDYAERSYAGFYPYDLDVHGKPTHGRVHEPHGVGYPLLIAPAYALGGAKLVELLMAAIAALAFVLGGVLARHVVPEPWVSAGVLLVGLSPPALAYGATIYPELLAGTLLTAAVLLALRARESPRLRTVYGAALMIAVLPWLGTKYLLPALPVIAALVYWTRRRGRRLTAIIAAEVVAGSLVVFATVNEQLFGGPTPYSAQSPGLTATDAEFPLGHLERVPRLLGLWLDRDFGLLRWAPVMGLAFLAVWLLWRSRRDRLARAVPGRADEEAAGLLALAACAGVVLIAAFAAPTMFGFWFPPRHLVAGLPLSVLFVAWGLRHTPRVLAFALGLATLAGSAWLFVELRTGAVDGWVAPGTDAPWGPLEALWPLYGTDSVWATVVSSLVLVALAGLLASELRSWRQTAGTTRRAYSP
jgi:hypothetical protein